MDDDDLINKTHPEFEVKCKKCGSLRVYVESTVGYSDLSGGWGGVSLHCADCGNEAEIFEMM